MKELQKCLEIASEIEKIDEKIKELKLLIASPKNQVITGMPRGGNTEHAIEKYLLQVEKEEQKKDKLLKYQAKQWQIALEKLPNISEQEKRMLHNRFIKGMAWKKCAKDLNDTYGNWNINKVFRIYRKLTKISKNFNKTIDKKL